MDRSDATHVAVGASLLGLGGAGMLTLLIYAASAKPDPWGQLWFLTAFSLTGLLALLGCYVFAAIYTSLPLPQTRAEREEAPRLTADDGVPVQAHAGASSVVFRVGFGNSGRRDIRQAIVNVVVPDFISQLCRCDEHAAVIPEGTQSHTAQPLLSDENDEPIESIYWNGQLAFPGRVYRPLYWMAQLAPIRDFPVRVTVTAAELRDEFEAEFWIRPTKVDSAGP